MSGFKVIFDAGRVTRDLHRLKSIGHDTAILRRFGLHMVRSVNKNFQAQGRPTKWDPLAESTKASYARMKRFGGGKIGGHKLLQFSGRLKRSIRSEVIGNVVEVGTHDVVYARIHQLGGKAGRGKRVTIPKREYLLLQPEDYTTFDSMIRDAVESYFK